MALAPGTHVGPYEILAPLGAGGMGVVFRARDTRLGRDVAIKALPDEFKGDLDRLRRFEQEARTAGSLDHPNVLVVLDVGQHEGSPYLVTELLEGATLRERLREGPIPLRKALDWAAQAARGLAAAHARGIVHRDLKPENLFITRDGRLKVLDFGIARATGPGGGSTLNATASGAVMGTAGYMAPEQVRGKPADHRSDLFSLGSVLFELLTGRQAFGGDTPVERGYAVLNSEPPDLATTPGLPLAVDRVVRRCLEKVPEERFQSAHDLAFALQSVADSPSSGLSPALQGSRVAPSRVLLGLGLVVVGAGAFAVGHVTRSPAEAVSSAPAKAAPPTFTRLSYRAGRLFTARFAPDGKTVVYGAAFEGGPPQIYAATIGKPDARPLTAPWTWLSDVSSQGELALFLSKPKAPNPAVLAISSIDGDSVREVMERPDWVRWSPDGQQLAIVRRVGPLNVLEYPIGKVLLQTDGYLDFPSVAPDGASVAVLVTQPGDFRPTLEVVSTQGVRRKLSGPWLSVEGVAWAHDGRSIWYAAGDRSSFRSIHVVTLDGQDRVALTAPGTLKLCDVAPDGRLLIIRPEERNSIVGRRALEPEVNLSWYDRSWPADLSADGRTMLFGVGGQAVASAGAGFKRSAGAASEFQAFVRPTDGSAAVRISEGRPGALSPDGRWAVVSTKAPFLSLTVVPIGAGEPRELPPGPFVDFDGVSYFPDGERLLMLARAQGHDFRFWVQRLAGGPPVPLTGEGAWSARPSPDSRFLAVTFDDGGASLLPLDGGPGRALEKLPWGRILGWSSDGGALFVRTFPSGQAGLPAEIARYELSTSRTTPWLRLSPSDVVGIPPAQGLARVVLSADGQSYVYGYLRDVGDLYVVDGVN